MKIKYTVFAVLLAVTLVAVAQMFAIPPYAGDLYGIYNSGYFSEIERQFAVIKDSFVETKMYGRPETAWMLLDDIGSRNGISIRVHDASGRLVTAPGQTGPSGDESVIRLLNSSKPSARSEVRGRMFRTLMPVYLEERCLFCHDAGRNGGLAGVISFERRYNAVVYYTSERIIIFSLIASFLCMLLYLTMRWDPGRRVKELFDKN
jgi:hypothetical protein